MRLVSFSEIVPIERGGTGATTAAQARTNLQITPANIGAAPTSHIHNTSELTGTLSISRGGTGGITAAQALANLGAAPIESGRYVLFHRNELLTTQANRNYDIDFPNNLLSGYLLYCLVAGNRGGSGGFLSERRIFLSRELGSFTFEVVSSLDRGAASGIFNFSIIANNTARIRINNGSTTQRQDYTIFCTVIGAGMTATFPYLLNVS